MEAILKFNLDGTGLAAEKVKKLVASSEIVMLGVLAVIVAVGGRLIGAIPRSMVGPVQQAVALAQTIAWPPPVPRLRRAITIYPAAPSTSPARWSKR